MSAQRRRDTIERFCVPVKDDESLFTPARGHDTESKSTYGCPTRQARTNRKATSDVIDLDDVDDDSDLLVSGGEGDDYSFAQDDEIVEVKQKSGEGKATAKVNSPTTRFDRTGTNAKVQLPQTRASVDVGN
jgi:SWI/SNF-related matrix-associated actin-dependent regulator of chromatin subfamily A3